MCVCVCVRFCVCMCAHLLALPQVLGQRVVHPRLHGAAEEALAALARHHVVVHARGLVPAHRAHVAPCDVVRRARG